jgi:ABC-type Fe3+-hydroxamate transport system substrate-binding protein
VRYFIKSFNSTRVRSFTDQISNSITLPGIPKRIVSLVPSQTELLADLGLDPEIVGITRYCVHPTHWKSGKVMVGGTKDADPDVIAGLQPDLVLGNREENSRSLIEGLREQFPVWISDVRSLDDAVNMIQTVGEMTGTSAKAQEIVSSIEEGFSQLIPSEKKTALYIIWRKPWMAAGSDTFIDSMLTLAGLHNCAKGLGRYPQLTAEAITKLHPDIVLLSSEPFPFQEKHMEEVRSLTDARILLVDGEMFSWYGSHLIKAPKYISSLRL